MTGQYPYWSLPFIVDNYSLLNYYMFFELHAKRYIIKGKILWNTMRSICVYQWCQSNGKLYYN